MPYFTTLRADLATCMARKAVHLGSMDGDLGMIVVTRLNGPPLAVNCDLIERVESTPDTILTLVDGTKYVIQESVQDVVDRIREFRASVLVMAQKLEQETEDEPTLRVVRDGEPEA